MSQDLRYSKLDKPRVEAAVREFLLAIGEDPDREGLQGTPDRVARACEEIFGGMQEDPEQLVARFARVIHSDLSDALNRFRLDAGQE